jgi:rhomboid protease GluP
VIGARVERALGRSAWIAAYLAGGLTGELVGWAGWQPLGAGNSVGVCGLAATLAVGGFVLTATVLLLAETDIHGAALAAGAAVGTAMRLAAPPSRVTSWRLP